MTFDVKGEEAIPFPLYNKVRSLSTGDIRHPENETDVKLQKQQLLQEVLNTKHALETKRKNRDNAVAPTQAVADLTNRYARAQTAVQEEGQRIALQLRQRKISTAIKVEGLEKLPDQGKELKEELSSLRKKLIKLDSTLQQTTESTKDALRQLDSQRLSEIESLRDSGLFEEALILQQKMISTPPSKSRSVSAESQTPDIVLTSEDGNQNKLLTSKKRSSGSFFNKLKKGKQTLQKLGRGSQDYGSPKDIPDGIFPSNKSIEYDSEPCTWYELCESGRRESIEDILEPQCVPGEPECIRTEINPEALQEIAEFEKFARDYFTANGQAFLCENFSSMTPTERRISMAEVLFL